MLVESLKTNVRQQSLLSWNHLDGKIFSSSLHNFGQTKESQRVDTRLVHSVTSKKREISDKGYTKVSTIVSSRHKRSLRAGTSTSDSRPRRCLLLTRVPLMSTDLLTSTDNGSEQVCVTMIKPQIYLYTRRLTVVDPWTFFTTESRRGGLDDLLFD